MRPFQAVAKIDAGGFAILSIDPTKRVGGGCEAIIQSLHVTEAEANEALSRPNQSTKGDTAK